MVFKRNYNRNKKNYTCKKTKQNRARRASRAGAHAAHTRPRAGAGVPVDVYFMCGRVYRPSLTVMRCTVTTVETPGSWQGRLGYKPRGGMRLRAVRKLKALSVRDHAAPRATAAAGLACGAAEKRRISAYSMNTQSHDKHIIHVHPLERCAPRLDPRHLTSTIEALTPGGTSALLSLCRLHGGSVTCVSRQRQA